MKIGVTYEKKDILRLVERDLLAQNIKVKSGTTLAYKGALLVTLDVETEDSDVAMGATVLPPQEAPARGRKKEPADPVDAAQELADMAGVIGESQQLVKTQHGKFEVRAGAGAGRTLGPNESLEFPRGK